MLGIGHDVMRNEISILLVVPDLAVIGGIITW